MNNPDLILFAISLLVPINIVCSLWIYREMLNLSGVLHCELNSEITGNYSPGPRKPNGVFYSSPNRKYNEHSITVAYLLDHSSNPELTLKLSKWQKISFIPSFLSFVITMYITISDNEKEYLYASIGIAILLIMNFIILLLRIVYREKYPLDEKVSAKLEKKKREQGKYSKTNITFFFVYIIAGALVTFMLFIGNSIVFGLGGTTEPENPTTNQADTIESQDEYYNGEFVNQMPTYSDVIRVVNDNGFEIKNTSVSFPHIEEEYIINSFVSENIDTRFEYYEYSIEHLDINDYEIIFNSMWEEICKDTAPDSEFFGTDSLERGGVSRCIVDSDYLKALYWKENTIIYICSERNSMSGIGDKIMYELGYI